ncbi:outer dynein arm-docking complex subunit 4 isoform X3 [Passer montanus]|uniref:outer dynein arm-docking complex subunit 4 isoform X3 n=1 Tax=Passer montanus TaxID=9160 RepID=UPI0019613AA1|nr:outer dynein arm-docking complex subunit 4 isoform X3 [Passer montanus]
MADDELPVVSFGSLMTEGTSLSRRGQHDKALGCFNDALKLRAGDKHCLITRSRCFLRLGDTENSLKDAEASLQIDSTFYEGLYQKAAALYAMGDFEFALVFYHRGRRLRPDLHKFQLGINKAEEAIINCIGNPSSVKLESKEELCFVSRQAELQSKNNKQKQQNKPKDQKDQKQTKKQSPKTEQELLGQLYADKAYLEKLLKDEDLMQSSTRQGVKVMDLVLGGISYLQQRRDFWQQQRPMYARLHERRALRQRRARDSKQKPSDIARAIAKDVEDIQLMLARGSAEESCRKAERLLKKIQAWSEDEVPNKNELIGNLHSCIGDAQLAMGQMEAALHSHKMDLDCARQNTLTDAVSRALDNIGHVYARSGKFQQAINTWEEKIPLAQSSLEKAWLFHEIGRCYLELDKAEVAQDYGQKSLQSAEEEGDVEWQLHATVLVAQAQVKLKDYRAAILNFERALEKARLVPSESAQNGIIAALDSVSKSFIAELNKGHEDGMNPSREDRLFSSESIKTTTENVEEEEKGN